ncbi:MAG: DnaJ domain-containing protein [Casimicrobiaceae bacterium]
MKATLYEALGVQPGTSDEDVRAALRRLIRKYYAKTRDGQGNVEEALRFINHASRILTDDARRQHYDEELALSAGTAEQKIAHVVSNAVIESGEQTDVHSAPLPAVPQLDDYLDSQPASRAPPEAMLHHPGLTERVATSMRSPFVALGLCVLFGAFIVAAVIHVTPPDVVPVAKQALVWMTLALLVLAIVYGVVHGIGSSRSRPSASKIGLAPQTDLAILNWRREKSVFMGASQPAEDASWIFQLRMAELEREKSGRTSEARPWARLCARMFDYALWGLVLALPLSELRAGGALGATLSYWLPHPFVAPVVITATWIPLEALLIAALGTTPGKWLFGVYLQFSISDAYARRDARAQIRRGFARALRVWWKGMAGGIPLLAPVTIALAYEKLAHEQETDWDFAEDCLVTHGPAGIANLATGVLGLAAMLWLYAVAWNAPMAEALAFVRTSIAHALPVPSPLAGSSGSGKIGIPGRPATPALAPATPAAALPAASASGAALPAGPDIGVSAGTQGGVDPEIDRLLAAHRARIAGFKVEGPRMLRAGNWRRAAELCREWTDIDLGNADAWRCLGDAQQALGNHKEALAAYRRAKQHDPNDPALDGAVERAQRGIITDFQAKYRR